MRAENSKTPHVVPPPGLHVALGGCPAKPGGAGGWNRTSARRRRFSIIAHGYQPWLLPLSYARMNPRCLPCSGEPGAYSIFPRYAPDAEGPTWEAPWSGERASNPQPTAWKAVALPFELSPHAADHTACRIITPNAISVATLNAMIRMFCHSMSAR